MLIGVVGVITLTKLIGPSNYGRYAAAVGVMLFLQNLATAGINIFLLRSARDERGSWNDQAFTLLLISGVACAALMAGGFGQMEKLARLDGLATETRWMVLLLPVIITAQVPLAIMERALQYRTVAALELTGQITYYAVSLPLALRGHLSSAPFLGWAAQQALVAAAQFGLARYRPKLAWDRGDVSQILRYGFSYSGSNLVWQLRALVNPLVVGRFAGLEAVGVIALAIRLTEYLTFVKAAAWRLSLAALGRMQGDLARIRRAIEDGMLMQLLAVGPVLVLFGWVGPAIVPRAFGVEWLPALTVFPFVAASYLANSVFNLHSSALYSLQRNGAVMTFHLVHVVVFAGAAVALVPVYGNMGYGGAELVALGSYVVVARAVRIYIGPVSSWAALAWSAAFILALFPTILGVFSVAGLAALATIPWSRNKALSVAYQIRGALRDR
jgi:PST family polysaccharide transporter